MGESVMKQISVLLFTALVSVGVAYAVEVVASAESPQTCMDMASCADSVTVITLGKDAGAVGLVYSGYNWWLDNSPSSVSLTDNDEAILTVSGEGIYEWTPDFVGTHTVKHIVGGVTLARTFKAEGPVLTISRGGNGGTICEIASSIGDGTIFFTTDGTEPTEESRVYTGPFAINPSVLTSVKAFCKVDGYPRSLTALKTFHPVADLEVVARAESPQSFADMRVGTGAPLEPKASEPIVWSGLWAADASAAVSITVNGTSFISRAGEGVAEWVPPAAGTYEFRHETEGSDEVLTATFELEAKDISLASVGIYCPPVVYTGGEHKPPVTSATWDGSELVEGADYTLSYSGNINVGTATVTLEGMGFFGGSYVTNFTVLPRSVTLTSGGDSKAYDGLALVKHEVAVGEDGFAAGEGATFNVTGSQTTVGSSENVFTYMLNEGTKAGNYEITTVNGTLTVTKATVGPGCGEEPGDGYVPTGGLSKFDTIFVYDAEGHTIDTNALVAAFGAAMVGGAAVEYAVDDGSGEGGHAGRVTLPWLVDAPVYTNAGEYVVWYRVTNPNYEDFTHVAKVTITNRSVTVTSADGNWTYDGLAHSSATVTAEGFVTGEGIVASNFAEIVEVGSAPNSFGYAFTDGTMAENYAVTCVTGTLTVAAADISGWTDSAKWSVTLSGDGAKYDGTEKTCAVTMVAYDGFAIPTFTVSGNKATDAGTYLLTVTGTGNFTGTVTKQWQIRSGSIVEAVTSYEGIYDGEGHGIAVAVTKPDGAAVRYALDANGPYAEDAILFTNVTEGAIAVWYTVEAENYATVTNFGTVNISPKALTDAMVTVADTAYVYDATAKTPTVTVTDGEPSILAESDYDVAYSDNINAGTDTAKVTVTGKGNYTGTVIKHFSIDKATYDMSGAKWDYPGAFAYDGTAKSVHVSSLPSGVTAAYTGNTAAAPGTYTAHAEFIYDATNYNKPEIADLVWVIKSAEETKLKETFDGLPAEIAPDGEGGWIVTVTNDIDSADLPIEIPDNVGYVTIDLGGHDLLGGDGRPAIAVVPGEGDGEPTQLTIANSGDDAIVQGGEGSPAIEVDDGAKDGVFVNIGEGVTVQGGDDFTPAIDGEVGTNEGTIVEPVRFHIPGEGAVTVPKTWKTGQKVTWKAKAEKGSVFARWEGAFVDSLNLSENERRDPSLAFIVPAGFDANLISAVFIPIDDDGLSELSFADGEGLPMGNEEGILFELKADVGEFWLVDDSRTYVSATVSGLPPGLKFNAKKMSVTGAPTRSGVYWVQVKAKNASGYQLAVNARMAVSGYTKETAEPNLAKTAYHPLTVVCATEGGTVAGTGVYAEGKKVSVSARPDRGRVFVGWYRDAALEKPMSFAAGDWRTATQSVTVPEVRYLFAKFVTADADKGSIELGVNGAALPSAPAGTPALATNVWAGVALRWRLAADALSSPTVKVEGLPPGLKFTAKDILKKGSKTEVEVPANTIYGAPSAATKAPATVKITVTTASKTTVDYTIALTVEALPDWVVGTFNGGDEGATQTTITITSAGKITGKEIQTFNYTYTISSAGFTKCEVDNDCYSEDWRGLKYTAVVAATTTGATLRYTLEIVQDEMGIGRARLLDNIDNTGDWIVTAGILYQAVNWKSEPWKSFASKFANKTLEYDIEDAYMLGTISLKFAATGAVTVKGKFLTVNPSTGKESTWKASGSAVLVPTSYDNEGFSARVNIVLPRSYTAGGGYGECLELEWDGEKFSIDE